MKSVKLIALTFVFFCISIGFQNCGSTFDANGSTKLSSLCKAQNINPLSPFSLEPIQIDPSKMAANQKLQVSSQNYSLIVNNQCFFNLKEPLNFLGQLVEVPESYGRSTKSAVTVSLPTGLPINELREEIENQPCLIGFTHNQDIRTSQATSLNINDPQSSQQAHLNFINYFESRNLQAKINRKVIVAVVDTGVDYNHSDLSNRMWRNANGEFGANFVTNTANPLDDDGHGTHVAGIIAAEENNGIGAAGLLTDFVEIMAIKSLDSGGGGTSQNVYNGIQYAISNGADIINLSIQAEGKNSLLEDALIDAVNAGIVVTVSTGNQGNQITEAQPYTPAYLGPPLQGVLSVASVDINTSGLSYFSNFSNSFAEISAPGSEVAGVTTAGILSTLPSNRWGRKSGTSQSAPMVTAAAAITIGVLKSYDVNFTAAAIENFIKFSGSRNNNALTSQVSQGRIVDLGILANNLEDYTDSGITEEDFNGLGPETSCTKK